MREIVLLALLAFPLVSNATLVEIKYWGTVYSAYGSLASTIDWPSEGDNISGTLYINTDLGAGNSRFVTGHAGTGPASQSEDWARASDGPSQDSFSIADWEGEYYNDGRGNVLSITDYVFFGFSADDFLTGTSLEQGFDVSNLAFSSGEMLTQRYWVVDYEHVYPREAWAHFRLDRVTATVPEPGTLPLFAAGILALLVAKLRRKGAAIASGMR